ncbi:MAG: SDR family NAD(P)-dependent oxidoreductase [Thermaerobacter sp.]|nr:SDR family NAD(P)-dependent oxidoreductase [Thermaerobacter sp.]
MRQIIVSGGGTGIGRATAEAFAALGDTVVITGRRPDVLRQAADEIRLAAGHERVVPQPADLSTPEGAVQVALAVRRLGMGSIDAVVHAAGGVDQLVTESLNDVATVWNRDFQRNVLTAVLLTEALRPDLKRPGGRIILISSVAAINGGGGSYSAAKAALHGWVVSLAKELGPVGITANAIAPGYVTDTEFFGDRMTLERHLRLVSRTVVGRAGLPTDIAAASVYLASREASYVTGQVLHVNGGAAFGR